MVIHKIISAQIKTLRIHNSIDKNNHRRYLNLKIYVQKNLIKWLPKTVQAYYMCKVNQIHVKICIFFLHY